MKRSLPLARRLALLCLLMVVGLFSGAAMAQSSPGSPEDAASQFYRWYLQQLVQNKDPFTERSDFLKAHVSMSLIAAIDKKMHSPDGMESDYFLQSQDYLDDWPEHIATRPSQTRGNTASLLVELGATKTSVLRLKVSMTKDGERWKIREVRKQ